MLRQLVDIALLRDFVRGLARSLGLRVGVYDARGESIIAADPMSESGRLSACGMQRIPPEPTMTNVPAHDPPQSVAFVESHGAWYVAAPVAVDGERIGWVALGEFREQPRPPAEWKQAALATGATDASVAAAWQRLPLLSRSGSSNIVVAARWGARLVSEWSLRESRLLAVTEEAALVGNIAELLTGRQELQAERHTQQQGHESEQPGIGQPLRSDQKSDAGDDGQRRQVRKLTDHT